MTKKQISICMEDHKMLYEKSLSDPTTISQLKYLKFALGVTKQCPSMAVLGETGEVPVILKGYHRMLTYWNRTRNMDDNTLVKKAYMENVTTNSDWCKTIQILNSSQNLHNEEIPDLKFPTVARHRLRENFSQYWKTRIEDRNREKKLHVYAQVKQHLQIDPYMDLPSFRDRQRITKFITSNHCLEVEKGRHENKPRDQRVCRACTLNHIEDEEHFLLHCDAYNDLRQAHFTTQSQNGDQEQHQQPIQQLLASYEHEPQVISQFLKNAFDLRDKLVNFHVTQLSMCGMKMTITRGQGDYTDKPVTKLQTTILQDHKLKISRKGKRSNAPV
jgi:hypothetical protein